MTDTIASRLQRLQEEFCELEDDFDRYAYLIELAGFLPPYPEAKRTDAHLVRDCQSHVWLDLFLRDGLFFLEADSDTYIIKGVLFLLQDLLCGLTPEAIAEARFDLLSVIGLTEHFSSTRQKGIGAVMEKIRQFAQTV